MKDLKIGQKVIVRAIARPEYTNNVRKWKRVIAAKDAIGWYVGFAYKQEGRYKYEEYDYPDSSGHCAHLEVTNTIKLARVKFRINSNDSFVFENDMEVIS